MDGIGIRAPAQMAQATGGPAAPRMMGSNIDHHGVHGATHVVVVVVVVDVVVVGASSRLVLRMYMQVYS